MILSSGIYIVGTVVTFAAVYAALKNVRENEKSRRTDQMINQNWENIQAKDFRDITSLEKRGDVVRAVLVAMAKLHILKVNESALQLETL